MLRLYLTLDALEHTTPLSQAVGRILQREQHTTRGHPDTAGGAWLPNSLWWGHEQQLHLMKQLQLKTVSFILVGKIWISASVKSF